LMIWGLCNSIRNPLDIEFIHIITHKA